MMISNSKHYGFARCRVGYDISDVKATGNIDGIVFYVSFTFYNFTRTGLGSSVSVMKQYQVPTLQPVCVITVSAIAIEDSSDE